MDHSSFVPALVWVVPFACLLLGIAILPLAAPHFWESNLRKLGVSVLLGLPVFFLYIVNAPHALAETARDYVSFMILLGSLFVISGGVQMDGDLEARPWVNSAFLAGGAVFASLVGTTGASMLLIRPLLQTNSERTYVVHTVVFFIFLVSNVGGSLTPSATRRCSLGISRACRSCGRCACCRPGSSPAPSCWRSTSRGTPGHTRGKRRTA